MAEQPYGVLPVIALDRWRARAEDRDLSALVAALRALRDDVWLPAARKVDHIVPGADLAVEAANAMLLRILCTSAGSRRPHGVEQLGSEYLHHLERGGLGLEAGWRARVQAASRPILDRLGVTWTPRLATLVASTVAVPLPGPLVTAESDLARLLLLGFVNAYGNDWYLVPLTLPVGCLHVVRSFVVKDTFDEEAIVDALGEGAKASAGGSPSSAFSLFRSTVRGSGSQRRLKGLLLISGVEPLSSEPLEVVRFFRDEAANLAWAIEATTTGVDGRPLHHGSAIVHADDSFGSGPGAPDAPLQYRLMSDVPAHWHPLVADEAQRFTLGDERAPKGRALRAGMRLRQEEIPADGVDLFRRSQLVRSADGRTIVWVGRRKRVGQGGGASGLRFDDLVPPRPCSPKR